MTTIRPTNPVVGRARAAAAASERRALDAAGAFARAGTTFRRCLDEVEADDDAAWARYSESAHEAIARLQADLVLAGARLSAERAAHHDEAGQAAEAASHLARRWLESLRDRAEFGVRDAVALAERAVDDLEQVARGLRHGSRRVQHAAAGPVEEARRAAAGAIHDARRALLVAATDASASDVAVDEDHRRPRPLR